MKLWRTPAQRRVLDQIGCGNYSPIMAKRTEAALLADGLIVRMSDTVMGNGPFAVRVKQFQMPLHVHLAWAASCTDEENRT